MAAVLLYAVAAFVVHTGLLFSPSRAAGDECPAICSCLGSIVDCSKKGLTEIPSDIPHWAKQLDLQSNEISSLPGDAFHGLEKLDKLTLSHNKLTAIPTFPNGSNLTTLELSHNTITNISAEALRPLQKLRVLELHYNQLTSLPAGSFPNLPSLHHLLLNNNKLASLDVGVFDNLTALDMLKLSKNKLTSLPKDYFKNMKKLRILDLNRNKIRSIQGLTFNGMDSLVTLKLKRNSIAELEDGAFYEMKKIETLQLDHNNIGSVTKGWLFGLKTLKQLSLSHCNISRVDADCWDHLEALEELDLTANKLTVVSARTFIRLVALNELKLNNNSIALIEEGAFSGLANLEALEMNYNEISWTNENMNGAFDGLTSLNRLELDSNRIKSIGKRAFSGLDRLQHLNLNDNAINSIQLNAFANFQTLKELRLNSSNLVCDCQLSWLPKWLRDQGFDSRVSGRCAHPGALRGRSIFEISLEEFDCDDYLRPKITRDLEEQKVILGSNVTLTCEAASSSKRPMAVIWKKDDMIYKKGEVETFGQTTDGELTKVMSMLHIDRVDYSAEGTYQCVISNELGTTYSTKATLVVQVYPWFTKKPTDITVRAGAVARLECAANGVPAPEVSWKKVGQDFPAARERRIHMMEPGDTVFIIREVKTRDQGIYSCTATSDAGLIVANATVQVQEVPAFVETMEDKTSEEGRTAVVECLSSGSPQPKITWLKDGQVMAITDRHFFSKDNQLLIIMKAELADTGAYTCEMTNTLGTERGTSYLTVHAAKSGDGGGAGGLDDESTTTGIIIIAVVCCVVGTSLVWVIIIYQTRKKSEEYSSTPTDETTLPGEGPGTPYNSSDRDSRSSPGPLPPPHFSGSYGHIEDEQAQAMLPPTGEDDADGSASSSLAALHRVARSDIDTDHSSSPSSRSTHSTGLLHTFHPHTHSQGGSQQEIGGVEACTSATELLQSYPGASQMGHSFPHSNYSPPRGVGHDSSRSRSVPHAPRPPELHNTTVDPRDYHISSSNSHLPSEEAVPASQSIPLPPRIPKDQQMLSRPLPPVPSPSSLSSHHTTSSSSRPNTESATSSLPRPVYTTSSSSESTPQPPNESSATSSLGRQRHLQHHHQPQYHIQQQYQQHHPYSQQQQQPQNYQHHHQHPHQLQHHHQQLQQHPKQQQSPGGSLSAIPNHLTSESLSLSNSYPRLPNRTS